jgi:hypothetical protein
MSRARFVSIFGPGMVLDAVESTSSGRQRPGVSGSAEPGAFAQVQPGSALCSIYVSDATAAQGCPRAIGDSPRAKPLRRKFWTLSACGNEPALMDFVANVAHAEVSKAPAAHVRPPKFTQWKTLGSAIPLDGDDATRRGSQES